MAGVQGFEVKILQADPHLPGIGEEGIRVPGIEQDLLSSRLKKK